MAPPEKCDPSMTFDAVAMIGQELAFFKNRYGTFLMIISLRYIIVIINEIVT